MSAVVPLARRRPRVIAGVYALRLLLSWWLALPIVSAVEATGLSQFPSGDALLFESSGLFLVEVARLAAPDLLAYASRGLLVLVPALAALIVLRAGEFTALAAPGKLEPGSWLERTLSALPSFLFLSGLALLLKLLLGGLGLGLAFQVVAALLHTLGERAADLTGLGVVVVILLLLVGLTLAFDCARARVVTHHERALSALGRAFALLARRPVALARAWAGPALLSAALVGLVAFLVPRLDVSQPSGLRVAGVFTLHQLAAFALVWFDAVWIAAALRLVTDLPREAAAPDDGAVVAEPVPSE